MLGPQLATLDDQTRIRAANVRTLLHALSGVSGLKPMFQLTDVEVGVSAFYKLPWLIESRLVRSEFIAAIQAEGVAMDAAFRGFTRRTSRRCRKMDALPNAQIAAQQTVILHHPVLLESVETVQQVGKAIRKVAEYL